MSTHHSGGQSLYDLDVKHISFSLTCLDVLPHNKERPFSLANSQVDR